MPETPKGSSLPIALFLGLVVALGLGLLVWRPALGPRGNLEGAAIGGEFSLVDERGQQRRWSDFAGQWRLVYFGYTFCPDVCPVDTAHLASGLKAFEKASPRRAARVQPLFITVDPARDTPAALAEFTDNFHPRLLGLTGSEEEIAATLKAFRVYARRVEGASKDSYLVDHMAAIYLFAPDGAPVAFIPGPEASPQAVEAMLDRFVR
ncbi:SCO family protein [Thermaurantiacus sp.]